MTDEEIADLVFRRDDPVPADLIMVFAAANELDMERRIQHAVRLYREGYAPRILVTGGGVLARKRPESRKMAQIARDLGVTSAVLLVEDQSSNTFENVQFSAAVLRAAGLLDELATVLLVSSEWHMCRVRYTTREYFPRSIRLVCCPTCDGCNRDNWTRSKTCRQEVADEALLLQTYLETGALFSSD